MQNGVFLRQLRHDIEGAFDAFDPVGVVNINGVNNDELRKKLFYLSDDFRRGNLCAVYVLAKICDVKSVGG